MPTAARKVRRLRGSRTHGWGQITQHRKSGRKGGRGKAGLHKHKWSWTVKYAPDYFKADSMKAKPSTLPKRWLNVGKLDLITTKISSEDKIQVNLTEKGYNKLLGEGMVKKAYRVIVSAYSQSAKTKIEHAGGEIVVG